MAVAWSTFAERLRELDDSADRWAIAPPLDSVFTPSTTGLSAAVATAAAAVPDMPFVLWDGERLREHVVEVQRILAEAGIGLSVGLKACATRNILSALARLGLYADAQSTGECTLAAESGFGTITATGPGFGPAAMLNALRSGVLFDAQSRTQLGQLLDAGVVGRLGVRVRVPLPKRLVHPSMNGTTSRFGVELDPVGLASIVDRRLDVRRVRVHTGEALSADVARTLEYRLRLGCLLRETHPDIDEINLGGGFISLSRDLSALAKAFAVVGEVLDDNAGKLGTRARCWVEPGSALLLDHAYLVTEVLDVSAETHAVTINASPWNIAPWTFAAVYVLADEPWPFTGDVYGPALYENDRLRRTEHKTDRGRMPKIGDRLIITAFGSYTLVHGRTFGQFPLPSQYVFDRDGYRPVE